MQLQKNTVTKHEQQGEPGKRLLVLVTANFTRYISSQLCTCLCSHVQCIRQVCVYLCVCVCV